jgi:hypothetical protein
MTVIAIMMVVAVHLVADHRTCRSAHGRADGAAVARIIRLIISAVRAVIALSVIAVGRRRITRSIVGIGSPIIGPAPIRSAIAPAIISRPGVNADAAAPITAIAAIAAIAVIAAVTAVPAAVAPVPAVVAPVPAVMTAMPAAMTAVAAMIASVSSVTAADMLGWSG